MKKINKNSGAASLFLVIFASLLFMTIALSYAAIMLRDQQQATAIDLSQKAYDAAMSGVEDAKVLLSRYYECQQNDSPICRKIREAVDSNECYSVAAGLVGGVNNLDSPYKETFIGSNTIGSSNATGSVAEKIDQAYTCNKIAVNTPDYKASLKEEESLVIPLFSRDQFNEVLISWHQNNDQEFVGSRPYWGGVLTKKSSGFDKLPILRMQYISDNQNETSFLTPAAAGDSGITIAANTTPRKPQIRCRLDVNPGEYRCSAKVKVSSAKNALLILKSPYRNTSIKVTLAENGAERQFDGVQPRVDVTARANDRFRRIEARLQLGVDFTYPGATMAIEDGICKNFSVTNSTRDYIPAHKCS